MILFMRTEMGNALWACYDDDMIDFRANGGGVRGDHAGDHAAIMRDR